MSGHDKLKAVTDALTKQFLAEGRLVEAGFRGLILTAYPDHAVMSPQQYRQLREAFFGGAQHLLGSIMGIVDPGEEVTDADMDRMGKIVAELDAFIAEYARDHISTQGNA